MRRSTVRIRSPAPGFSRAGAVWLSRATSFGSPLVYGNLRVEVVEAIGADVTRVRMGIGFFLGSMVPRWTRKMCWGNPAVHTPVSASQSRFRNSQGLRAEQGSQSSPIRNAPFSQRGASSQRPRARGGSARSRQSRERKHLLRRDPLARNLDQLQNHPERVFGVQVSISAVA